MRLVRINPEELAYKMAVAGISVLQLERRSGVYHQTIYSILRGEACRVDTLVKLGKALADLPVAPGVAELVARPVGLLS